MVPEDLRIKAWPQKGLVGHCLNPEPDVRLGNSSMKTAAFGRPPDFGEMGLPSLLTDPFCAANFFRLDPVPALGTPGYGSRCRSDSERRCCAQVLSYRHMGSHFGTGAPPISVY